MDAFVDRIVQYSAKDNAEMRCRIKISGKWFGGRLTVAERLVDYDAEANGWKPSHKFNKRGAWSAVTSAAVRFICESDVIDDPTHTNMSQCPMSVSAALSLECYAVLGWCGFWLLRTHS